MENERTERNFAQSMIPEWKDNSSKFSGPIVSVPVDDQETFLRQIFDKSYAVNYKDGDKQSILFFKSRFSGFKKGSHSKEMYHSPQVWFG